MATQSFYLYLYYKSRKKYSSFLKVQSNYNPYLFIWHSCEE